MKKSVIWFTQKTISDDAERKQILQDGLAKISAIKGVQIINVLHNCCAAVILSDSGPLEEIEALGLFIVAVDNSKKPYVASFPEKYFEAGHKIMMEMQANKPKKPSIDFKKQFQTLFGALFGSLASLLIIQFLSVSIIDKLTKNFLILMSLGTTFASLCAILATTCAYFLLRNSD